MSLVPERISVKRRRSDEPVDTLFLEHGTAPDKKRRVTDFYFQRLQDETIAPVSEREKSPLTPQRPQPSIPGIPSVRWTSPGDEKRDYERLKAKLQEKGDNTTVVGATKTTGSEEAHPTPIAGSRSAPPTPRSSEGLQQTRRFHLTRHLSSVLSPSSSGGIRKPKTAIRPPLATFVERYGATFSHEESPLYKESPLDNVLNVPNDGNSDPTASDAPLPSMETLEASKRIAVNPFLQASSQSVRKGTSIRDHPSTWDHESDQLADELAALAMELDPDVKAKADAEALSRPAPTPKDPTKVSSGHEESYVYETYIRVRHNDETPAPLSLAGSNTVGVLVIEDEDEDLWQKYVDSDDDTDWDEEDSNAEENPANDYPEDEVSSDDEYGYNAYKYRQYGSDDETFGSDNDDLKETGNKW